MVLYEVKIQVIREEDQKPKINVEAPHDALLALRILNDGMKVTLDRIQQTQADEKVEPELSIVRP